MKDLELGNDMSSASLWKDPRWQVGHGWTGQGEKQVFQVGDESVVRAGPREMFHVDLTAFRASVDVGLGRLLE